MRSCKYANALRALLAGALLTACASVPAAPELDPGTLYDYLGPRQLTFTKRISNLGDTTAFIKVEVAEIIYNEQGEPREPAFDSADRPLVASPTRLIIPAGGSRELRLVYRQARPAERYFRLRFVPVAPTTDDLATLPIPEREQYRQAVSARVGLMKAIGGVVLVSPRPSYFKTDIAQQGSSLRVTNNGNTTVVLEDLALCQATGTCEQGRTVHIRPGHTFTSAAQEGRRFGFTLREGEHTRRYAP